MLLYSIAKEDKEKYDLIKAVMDHVTMSINPFYLPGTGSTKKADTNGASPVYLAEGERYNAEYERHSRSARETGVPDLSPMMKQAFDSIYRKPKSNENRIYLTGEEGTPVVPISNSDILGDD